MVEDRATYEELEPRGLRLAPKAPDGDSIVVHSAADAIAVLVIRVGMTQDFPVGDLGQKACPEERNGVPRRARARERIGRSASGVVRELGLDAVLASLHDNVRSELATHEKKVPIVARAPADHRLLVAAGAERHVELRTEPLVARESMQRDLSSPFEGF